MCRIALYVLPQTVRDRAPGQRPSYYLPGDVVAIAEDGAFMGADIELGHPAGLPAEPKWWRILEVPGLSAQDPRVLSLLDREEGSWKRKRHVHLPSLHPTRALMRLDDLPIVEKDPMR